MGGGTIYEYWTQCSQTIQASRRMAICDSDKYASRSVFDGRGEYRSREHISSLSLQDSKESETLSKRLPMKNIALVCDRGSKLQEIDNFFISENIIDIHLVGSGSYAFPLYLYNTYNTRKILTKENSK